MTFLSLCSTIYLTLMMTSAQVVEMLVSVPSNSPSKDYTHKDDHGHFYTRGSIVRLDELGQTFVVHLVTLYVSLV